MKLKMQSVAFDFVLNQGLPEIVEASYGFGIDEGESDGYCTPDGVRHNDYFDPLEMIIGNFITTLLNAE